MQSLLMLVLLLLQNPAAPTYMVSGRVTKFPDATNAPSMVILRSFALKEAPGQGQRTTVRPDGTFEFAGVVPTECDLNLYDDSKPFQKVLLSPRSIPVAQNTEIGPGLNFTFRNRNVTGIEIKVPAGITGRIVMASGQPIPRPLTLRATTKLSYDDSFGSARSMYALTVSDSDGRFTLGVFPGQNTIAVNLPAGYALRSITYGSLDITRAPLNLTSLPSSTLLITLERQNP